MPARVSAYIYAFNKYLLGNNIAGVLLSACLSPEVTLACKQEAIKIKKNNHTHLICFLVFISIRTVSAILI